MLKSISAVLVLAPLVIATQLNLRSEVVRRQGTCPSDAPVSCGGDFCRPSDATCCPNGHYCPSGQFCAPVVGYCCRNGEDPATCAVRQGFSLPPSSATSVQVSTTVRAVTSAQAATSMGAAPVTSSTSAITSPTAASTASLPQFSGAAARKESAVEVIVAGAIGLVFAL